MKSGRIKNSFLGFITLILCWAQVLCKTQGWILGILLLGPALVFAADGSPSQTSQSSAQASIPPVESASIVSGKFSLENSQNLYNDVNKINSTELTLWPTFKLGESSLSILVSISQDHQGVQNSTLSNTAVTWTLPSVKDLAGGLKWAPSLSATLPTDREAYKNNRLQGGLAVISTLGKSKETSSIPLDMAWSIRLGRNIHEFNLSAEGEPLVEYSLRNRLSFEYYFTDAVTVSLLSDYLLGRTYGGVIRPKFANALDLNLEVIKNWVVNMGVSTDGDALKYNGTDSNIELFNENTSVLRLGITYVL